MGTVDDIRFSWIYSTLQHTFVLLYDRSNVDPLIKFQRAHQLTCLRLFHDSNDYQNYIDQHEITKITLYASARKIRNWDENYRIHDDKLHRLVTYYFDGNERHQMRDWNGRHQWENKGIVSIDKLERQLLSSALEYIEMIIDDCGDDADGVKDQFEDDARKVLHLIDGYWENRILKTSIEARDNIS